MPNWCDGYVIAKGKPKDLENFCKLFIFEDEGGDKKKEQKEYFARSFVSYDNFKAFKKEKLGKNEVEFCVSFAWSCHSCLVSGYPDDFEECITLEEACRRFNVSVEIETQEEGLGFMEFIKADKNGVTEEVKDIPEYKCLKCGAVRGICPNYDIEDECCYDCEEIGKFERVKE